MPQHLRLWATFCAAKRWPFLVVCREVDVAAWCCPAHLRGPAANDDAPRAPEAA